MRDWLAGRAARAEASRTILANQRVEELRRQGVDVVSLAVGEPDFATPTHIKDAAKQALDEDFTHYTASAGILELREAIAERSRKENGIPAEAARTLVTPTKHGLFASLMATVEPGDEVLVTDPCFVSYVPQVKLFGGVPVPVPLRKENGYTLDPDDVAQRVTRRTKLLMLCSPNNPTGMLDPPETVRALVDLAVDRDFLLLSDEIYEKIVYAGRHVSPASLPGGAERTITLNGLSKSHAMTGWRIGWLHAPDPVFSAIARIQTQSITHVTSFVQKAAVAAIRGPQDSVRRMVEEFRARRDLVVKEIGRTPGWGVVPPTGAFYAWPSFDAATSADDFADFLLDRARVAVVSGTAFGAGGEHHLRLSYATTRRNLEEAFRRIREALPQAEKGRARAPAKKVSARSSSRR